ncbi:MAG: cyclic nucleotide-binding domain-containing protein [Chitinivibrionales bacterium]|nr:cyclic nucleotide-binding domain-containing protein [Chitinivibrionales bacterium]
MGAALRKRYGRSIVATSSKIGAGRNVVRQNEKKLRKGSLLFIEDEMSTEMYIIRAGKVRILKQEGENTIELAILGPGSVLGELSLLDNQPRSATAQVTEDLVATVIDQNLFERTMEKVPSWLSNMIRVVVKRLRDTMKRTSDDVVQKNVGGVIRILLLLYDNEGVSLDDTRFIYLSRAKEMVYATIGLGGIEAENVFLHLILKEMVVIRKNELGQEYILIKDYVVLSMYMSYLRTKQRGAEFLGENLSEKAMDLICIIQAAGEKHGRKTPNNLMKVGTAQVEIELERRENERHIDLDALDELMAAKVVIEQQDVTESKYGKHKRGTLAYNPNALIRLQLLRQWLPVFKEEIQF